MISNLNDVQVQVFQKVKTIIEAQLSASSTEDVEILRLFVSGCSRTGENHLIKTIRAWVQTTTGKDVAVAAPTGIASCNINGLTIHSWNVHAVCRTREVHLHIDLCLMMH